MFVQQLDQASKETEIEVPDYWLFVREFSSHKWPVMHKINWET